MKVDGFDSGNSFKNEAKHGISRETVEAFFGRRVWVALDPKHSRTEDRFLAIGRGAGQRPMIVAFTGGQVPVLRFGVGRVVGKYNLERGTLRRDPVHGRRTIANDPICEELKTED